VIHGRAGGEIPAAVEEFAAELTDRRGAPVAIEALSAGPVQLPRLAGRLGLVPLLLLPGWHVRRDLPAIRQRLVAGGMDVRLHPFLGAWPAWLDHLHRCLDAMRRQGRQPALVHHPLDTALGRRYLSMLERRLEVPLLSTDDARDSCGGGREPRCLLPLALAPNRMTDALASLPLEAPHLLAHPPSRSLLLELLRRLP
jgi:sirohydrochlorin ferrochelatase